MSESGSDSHDSSVSESAASTSNETTTTGGSGPAMGGFGAGAEHFALSVRELQQMVARQRDEIIVLRDEATRYRAREVEISALSVKLQQQFVATQGQIDHLKGTIRLQLVNPITEKEYLELEARPETERDLLDTVKIGIYTQLGSLKAARDGAVRKASELALELESTNAKLRTLQQDLNDANLGRETESVSHKRMEALAEARQTTIMEQASKIKDLEARLSSIHIDQERHVDTKVQLQHKIGEVARLEMLLKQSEGDVAKYKTSLACAEEKLDILKSEFYDLKLQYGQKILMLENSLRIAEEKLTMMSDVELEAEVFIANMATQQERVEAAGTVNSADISLGVIPPSRRTQHALTITKKCLTLENKVASLQHELRHKDEVIAKLTSSLEMARSALAAQEGAKEGGGSYRLIEDAVEKLIKDKELLQAQNKGLRAENEIMAKQIAELQQDLKILQGHREELVLIREQLQGYAALLQGEMHQRAGGNSVSSNLNSIMHPNAEVHNGSGNVKPLASVAAVPTNTQAANDKTTTPTEHRESFSSNPFTGQSVYASSLSFPGQGDSAPAGTINKGSFNREVASALKGRTALAPGLIEIS